MLATEQALIEYGLATKDKALEMAPKIAVAEQSVRCLIGDTKYDELLSLDETASAALLAEQERVKHAEALYAWYHASPFLNLTPADCGGFVKATGFDSTRVEIMSKRELDSYRKEAKAQATELLGDLLQVDGAVFAAI